MSALRRAIAAFLAWPRRYHGLLAGVVLWALWLLVGFWRTLLLAVLAATGYTIGRVLEENQSWRELLDKLLSDRYTE
ncbi:small integral membrane protein DUF2273 [Alicyclobacillus sacchari]|uniref:Small integral membrane protein DUF2273 n=1 Tax=Alicyclobacillus sacchari TaxID=392010 RepID=A0A4R8LIY0_9BACL|nr:DUF2273 domain-containing protein [Alicyclobacillus sacchari]TDY43403.1 small integral membrane protein DUF2273 [Alicyclobacillus sacchari]GMA55848.1 hypothetical protein GCM10025858_03510 [Alicyclobacillus sacchari]